jgi:hypothetical protein
MKIILEVDRVIEEPTPCACRDRVTNACCGTAYFDGKATLKRPRYDAGSFKWKKQAEELVIQSWGEFI